MRPSSVFAAAGVAAHDDDLRLPGADVGFAVLAGGVDVALGAGLADHQPLFGQKTHRFGDGEDADVPAFGQLARGREDVSVAEHSGLDVVADVACDLLMQRFPTGQWRAGGRHGVSSYQRHRATGIPKKYQVICWLPTLLAHVYAAQMPSNTNFRSNS